MFNIAGARNRVRGNTLMGKQEWYGKQPRRIAEDQYRTKVAAQSRRNSLCQED